MRPHHIKSPVQYTGLRVGLPGGAVAPALHRLAVLSNHCLPSRRPPSFGSHLPLRDVLCCQSSRSSSELNPWHQSADIPGIFERVTSRLLTTPTFESDRKPASCSMWEECAATVSCLGPESGDDTVTSAVCIQSCSSSAASSDGLCCCNPGTVSTCSFATSLCCKDNHSPVHANVLVNHVKLLVGLLAIQMQKSQCSLRSP